MSTIYKTILSASHVAIFVYGFRLQKNDQELSHINEIGFSIFCSRGAALCLAFDMALIMIPMCRKLLSYVSWILASLFRIERGAVSEGSNSSTTYYHKYLAYHILAFTIIHVLGHCVNFYRLEQLGRGSAMSYHLGTWAGITGYWMLLLLGVMFITAHRRIRKSNYEVFYYTHHLAVLVAIFFAFHGYGCFVQTNDGQCRGYGSWRYVVLAMFIYMFEKFLRMTESRQTLMLTSAIAHPGRAIELNFIQPSLQYRPGQHIYLNIPQLSKYEWHPFTITSSPIEQCISLDIRQDGDWTGQLGQLLGHGRDQPRLELATPVLDRSLLPLIRVDGPYGGPKEDVLGFDHAVLIGTGNGITTFSGILRHIWFRHQETQSSRLQTLDLYWVSRDSNKLDWFKSLFSMEKTVELFKTGLIRIHIYFTTSGRTQHRWSTKPVRPTPVPRNSKDSVHSLQSIRTENLTKTAQYSDDDEDNGEDEDLLSPRDVLLSGGISTGSSSLNSLASIESPTPPPPTQSRRTRALGSQEAGEEIIGPNNIHYGRPDFAALFENMTQALSREDHDDRRRRPIKVGVFYCGSFGLSKTLAQECRRSTTSNIQFTFLPE